MMQGKNSQSRGRMRRGGCWGSGQSMESFPCTLRNLNFLYGPIILHCFLTRWVGNSCSGNHLSWWDATDITLARGLWTTVILPLLSQIKPLERWWLWTSSISYRKLLKNFEQESDTAYFILESSHWWLCVRINLRWTRQKPKPWDFIKGEGKKGKEGAEQRKPKKPCS